MSKYETQTINVLNYNQNQIFVDGSKEHYTFSASPDGITPSIVPMSFQELQYIASNTNIISTGWLTFEPSEKEELYKQLKIPNWEMILSNEDIRDILINPTVEKLRKILDITNVAYFDRIRMIYNQLVSDGYDITIKVEKLIDSRANELRLKQRKTSIRLGDNKFSKNSPAEVEALKQQNEILENKINELTAMMQGFLSKTANSINDMNESKEDINVKETVKKKQGRPRKTS